MFLEELSWNLFFTSFRTVVLHRIFPGKEERLPKPFLERLSAQSWVHPPNCLQFFRARNRNAFEFLQFHTFYPSRSGDRYEPRFSVLPADTPSSGGPASRPAGKPFFRRSLPMSSLRQDARQEFSAAPASA